MPIEYIVSGCLAGLPCKYDGGSNPCAYVVDLYKSGKAVALCPESLSGLKSPRPPCELRNGRVFSRTGEDVTEAFLHGAKLALAKALSYNCRKAILKSRSPSCGFGQIYDGSFSRSLCNGNGVWAQMLANEGFEIYSEENLPHLQD